jgi:hypothetical protein
MNKNLLTLIEGVLASTARTVRAAVLIVAIGLVTGAIPGVDLPVREPSSTAVTVAPDQQGRDRLMPSQPTARAK